MMISPNRRTVPSRNPQGREALIRELTEGITPIARVTNRQGIALVAFATIAAAIAAIAIHGFWMGIVSGEASAMFWITNLLLLLLGAASTSALVASALLRVGSRSSAPLWGAAMLGVVPLAALLTLVPAATAHSHGADTLAEPLLWYWECAAYGLAAGLLVAFAAVMFLRRGAPVSLERAGWLTGLAAGALGSVAYGITCPLDGLHHVGIVHVAPVAIGAVLGRLVVPRLIRW